MLCLLAALAFDCCVALLLEAAEEMALLDCLASDFLRWAGLDPSAREPLRFFSVLLLAPEADVELAAAELDA